QKLSIYGETCYDWKLRYSLNCQLTNMPHNLLIIDYGLHHSRSIHDAYVFQGTLLARNPKHLILHDH
ncbi:hypothetical protein SCLCIDRAFT_121160, partial [Scleroderma citrinum Foug A]